MVPPKSYADMLRGARGSPPARQVSPASTMASMTAATPPRLGPLPVLSPSTSSSAVLLVSPEPQVQKSQQTDATVTATNRSYAAALKGTQSACEKTILHPEEHHLWFPFSTPLPINSLNSQLTLPKGPSKASLPQQQPPSSPAVLGSSVELSPQSKPTSQGRLNLQEEMEETPTQSSLLSAEPECSLEPSSKPSSETELEPDGMM